jgi:hypothetical protein
MRITLLIISFFYFLNAFGQDTISRSKTYSGGWKYFIVEDADTFFVHTYSNGEMESRIEYSNDSVALRYQRWFNNGNLMWDHTLVKSKRHGNAKFYHESGKLIAEFTFENDQVKDTLFVSKKHSFIFGRHTYHSIVYGGMRRADGSSNISGGHGVSMHTPMYIVKLDPKKAKQEIYKGFRTDFNGYYYITISKGEYGIFPERFEINEVSSTMGSPGSTNGMSHHSSWNIQSPIHIHKNYHYLDLHFESVGYAP